MTAKAPRGHIIDTARLVEHFPTHRHESAFWESLGRAVATFGFLEEMLAKAIFAFTAIRPYEESEIEKAFEQWLPKLERALTDPLGGLIDSFGKAVRDHPEEAISDLPDLLSDLKKAAAMRNILSHGSWRLPDAHGAAVPLFVNRQKEVVETAMDCAYLGTTGPGKPIWERQA
uniref:RiboL-PSP-HEPN domain-containing protein n=1 Tax=Candidatus Kentrum sp. TC TaxID=2126339 RepID=A0A450ZR93_9GAMM|nr:MAG: hypothetical protein BECKTC1821E_GA0114239_11022 [Candidatus Kentron sp. TC]VFK56221.1 MAG: hypothetical protein BECKTC1821F_GA0114240_100958 [Candidatus Kentron sp. TC]